MLFVLWDSHLGTTVHPGGGVHHQVDHEGVRTRPVPGLLPRGEVEDIAGSDLDYLFVLLLRPPGSGDDVKDLALRARMPVRPRTGLEEHAEVLALGAEAGATYIQMVPVNHSSGPRRVSRFSAETTFTVFLPRVGKLAGQQFSLSAFVLVLPAD